MRRILFHLLLAWLLFATTATAAKLTIFTEEFPPFNFSENQKITGVSTEVVSHVMAQTGIAYEIQSLPWEQSYQLAQQQSNALIFSISRNDRREALFKWIGILTPTTYSAMTLASRSDIEIQHLDDMKQYKIGTTKDDIVESWLFGNGFAPGDLVRTSGDNAALKNFKKLLNRRIDIWPFPDAVAYYIVRKEGHSRPESLIRKAFAIEELSGGYYVAASLNTSDVIVARIAKALRKFKQTDGYYKILAHWGVDAMGLKTEAPITKLIYSMRHFNRIVTIGYLASDNLSSHRNAGLYRKEIRENFVEAYVRSFDQWREMYSRMQNEVDALIIGDITGIAGWDADTARQTVQSATTIPSGCVLGHIAEYAMIGYDENDFIINMKIANHLGRKIPKSYLKKATRLIQ